MSAALNARADTSAQSAGTVPDLSLSSLTSAFSTPGRALRVPSASSHTTATSSAPISTPSPPNVPSLSRRRGDEATPALKRLGLSSYEEEGEEAEADVLDTPGREKKWEDPATTPAAGRMKRTRSAGSKGGVNLTLRDQEKASGRIARCCPDCASGLGTSGLQDQASSAMQLMVDIGQHIDSLKKENFNIKLKVHFLEERLAQLAPDQIEAALKQNINLKIEVQQRGMELKKLRKLVLEQQRELERLQRGNGSQSRARELEEKLEEREREIRELRRRRAVGPNDGVLRELEARNAELEEELENVRGLLEENTEEMERLRDLVERRGDDSAEEDRSDRWRRRIEEVEDENEDLRTRIDELEELVTHGNDEKEDLADMVEALKLDIENLQRRREAESVERSQSRVQILEEREEREAVEEDLNAFRDKLAAAHIELQQKEDDLDMKDREIEEVVAEHKRIVETLDDEWRGEMDELRGQVEELKDVLEQKDGENRDLRMSLAEVENGMAELQDQTEIAVGHLQQESEEKDAEIEAANREIEKLGHQVYMLEEENERMKDASDRLREDEAVERERLEALASALKEKVAGLKAQLEEMHDLIDARDHDIATYRARSEELAQHVENLVQEVQRERAAREHLEADIARAEKEHDAALRAEQRALEAKESALQSALNDLARTQSILTQRENDLAQVQSALETLEAESKKLGETHTTARFSLQLEVDRLKRDLERLEDELSRARNELGDREGKGRERDGVIDKLHAENRELASQLAAQTQARLNVSQKLENTIESLKAAESEVVQFKTKIAELEQRLAKDQRSLLSAEAQYRDQLTERNTLLLTIYQYMDKILGVDKTPKKNGQAETKPFTNFGVFHDNLISRLKQLSEIQGLFDKRVKDAESKYAEKLSDMRKQLDFRWKQIDKFETSLKTVAEAKTSWRKKLSAREGEVEALKTTVSELQAQLVSIRKPGQGDSMEVRALAARANNAERRITNLQNQLLLSEERLTTMNQKTVTADSKWEVRVKEYETRLKKAEEAVKRERQGAKERVYELETQLKTLQRQLELENKRNQRLQEITESNGLNNRSPRPS
ncbi:uncharacterized protein C8Q71DRAFT_719987 [Rhodofomes roseus]|uniref:Centrosomin N-terminal motif 1 domain-containing protein n=1 Tax=Rhodofomes roseus TaxID=34475 RepID=A0ABQ8KTL1_9APHY|nr:uncharacterized protein C8Q71DRAFT_719987 [Rhodofomes roseus]KAH9842418.1 hypothetical protein C8Q71DRAFT_719987 [Rhodofomes roseus]